MKKLNKITEILKRPEGMDDDTYYQLVAVTAVEITLKMFGMDATKLNGNGAFLFNLKDEESVTNVLSAILSVDWAEIVMMIDELIEESECASS